MPILYVHNGKLLIKDSKLAMGTDCCCSNGGCTRDTTGCCCFGVGSLGNIDECDCVTMGGTWRASCDDCTSTDGGNGGDGGIGPDEAPPSGQCNVCKDMSIGYLVQDREWGGCAYESCPGNYGGAGYDTCTTAALDCSTYGLMPTVWKYYHCDLAFTNCTMGSVGGGPLGCTCVNETTCDNTDGCGVVHEAYRYTTYRLSGSACGAVGAFEEVTNTDTYLSGTCTPSGNHYVAKEYIVRQLVGRINSGDSVTKVAGSRYLAQQSGACTQTATGSDSTSYTLTC